MSEERSHQDALDEIDDGCGCAEIWEELSEHRSESTAVAGDD